MSDITKLKISEAPEIAEALIDLTSDYALIIDSSDSGKIKRTKVDNIVFTGKEQTISDKGLRDCFVITDDNEEIDIATEIISLRASASGSGSTNRNVINIQQLIIGGIKPYTVFGFDPEVVYIPLNGFTATIYIDNGGGEIIVRPCHLNIQEINQELAVVKILPYEWQDYSSATGWVVVEYNVKELQKK